MEIALNFKIQSLYNILNLITYTVQLLYNLEIHIGLGQGKGREEGSVFHIIRNYLIYRVELCFCLWYRNTSTIPPSISTQTQKHKNTDTQFQNRSQWLALGYFLFLYNLPVFLKKEKGKEKHFTATVFLSFCNTIDTPTQHKLNSSQTVCACVFK